MAFKKSFLSLSKTIEKVRAQTTKAAKVKYVFTKVYIEFSMKTLNIYKVSFCTLLKFQ